MKVVELRMLKIEPEIGEEVTVETNEYTYSCIAEKIKELSCEGCLFDRLQKCEYIRCSGRFRRDGNEIIIKCTSKKEGRLKMYRVSMSDNVLFEPEEGEVFFAEVPNKRIDRKVNMKILTFEDLSE